MALRTVIVCADDFGESEAKSAAILTLVRHERISAVSCMTESSLWEAYGSRLRREGVHAQIGLHFDLTSSCGGPAKGLAVLMTQSLLGRVDTANVRAQLERQLGSFERVIGRPPDFIDGHEHVHAFPQIASIVRGVAAERPGMRVRSLAVMFGRTDAPLKRLVIRTMAALGSREARGREVALPLNTAFAGDYSMRGSADFPALFESWLDAAPSGALIMCHPSLTGSGARELEYLRSAGYLEALQRSGVRLVPAERMNSAGVSV